MNDFDVNPLTFKNFTGIFVASLLQAQLHEQSPVKFHQRHRANKPLATHKRTHGRTT